MTKPANWAQFLKSCNRDNIELFDSTFLKQWSGEAWPPSNEDRVAAAKLHGQLVSRITTQRLPYVDGEEAAALKSVYQLFGETRDIFKAHPTCKMADAIVWYVLNTHVRPFTAKWHRQNERGALAALDATDIFRAELARLQQLLTRFDALLVAIRDGAAPLDTPAPGQTAREAAVAEEMSRDLKWGIHESLGGLPTEIAREINDYERTAIEARRTFYADGLRRHLVAANAGDAAGQAAATPPAAGGSAEPRDPDAWEKRPHAVALAISGGGIRSATFALGVVVALARRNLLFQFDYLSTVSGGGYLGSFLTTFLNAAAPPAAVRPGISLLREDLPFRREDGEAAALRHVRHHSKYLATGRLWERLQMAFAQVYGMAMNGLGFVYLAIVTALAEYVLRPILPDRWIWPYLIVAVAIVLALMPIMLPTVLLKTPRWRKSADAILAVPFLLLLVLLAWLGLGYLHDEFARMGPQPWLIAVAIVPLIASGLLALAGNLPLPVRIVLIVISAIAAPLLFLGIELAAYNLIGGETRVWGIGAVSNIFIALVIAAGGLWLFTDLFDINFTAPHRHYKKKLGEAYLVQPDPANVDAPLRNNVSLKLSDCTGGAAPYHLVNCALNVPASENPQMQGRLTDFFLFSSGYCGSPLTGYEPTGKWEELDQTLDLGTAMAISGAAAAPQMGTGTIKNLSFWLALFNVRLSYWIRNPAVSPGGKETPPGLSYLLQEMFGWANEKRPYVNVSDGGHIENLGVYELLRRRCKYIVAIDGEQDAKMTFQGLTTLQRLAAIDLGVTIDIGVDALRLGDKGLSHSHFAFCRIRYPTHSRDAGESYGYLIYLKLSLTGNEGEFIHRYRLDEPEFPHHSTANQFFTEAQFEAYRSLGEHVGDKLFLPAIVGPDMAARGADVKAEEWFQAIGKSMLEPLPGA